MFVSFEVLTTITVKVTELWHVMLCFLYLSTRLQVRGWRTSTNISEEHGTCIFRVGEYYNRVLQNIGTCPSNSMVGLPTYV